MEFRFFQGFETDTAGIFDSDDAWYGTVTRVASGTNGIESATGDFHAIVEDDGTSAPFTRYGGFEDSFTGDWTMSVDIYLDATDDGGGLAAGEGFDFSSAASGSDGLHQRDFVFHVTQDTSTGELLINATNNSNFAPREDLETLTGTVQIDEDGWYSFQHHFYDDDGVLAVDMLVFNENGDQIFSTTRSDASDVIAEIGGNRQGWFTNIDVAGGIAIDNLSLAYDEEQVAQLPEADSVFFV